MYLPDVRWPQLGYWRYPAKAITGSPQLENIREKSQMYSKRRRINILDTGHSQRAFLSDDITTSEVSPFWFLMRVFLYNSNLRGMRVNMVIWGGRRSKRRKDYHAHPFPLYFADYVFSLLTCWLALKVGITRDSVPDLLVFTYYSCLGSHLLPQFQLRCLFYNTTLWIYFVLCMYHLPFSTRIST